MRKKLRAARNYEVVRAFHYLHSFNRWSCLTKDWKKSAEMLDRYLQFDEWKKVDEDPFYDWKLVRKVCLDSTRKDSTNF